LGGGIFLFWQGVGWGDGGAGGYNSAFIPKQQVKINREIGLFAEGRAN